MNNVHKCLMFTLAISSSLTFADNKTKFEADFFIKFSPNNALEAVKNIPGFTLNLGKNVRGLAGGGGNVLVDGVRVSSKSGGLTEVLSRIPFAQIERIEILRGGSDVSDTNTQSVNANVVRKKATSAGQAALNLYYNNGENWYSTGEMSYATQLSEWESTFKVNVIGQKKPQESKYLSVYSNNSPNEVKTEEKETSLNELFISSEFSKSETDEKTQVTMRLGQSQYRPKIYRQAHQQDALIYQFHNDRNSIYQTAELGVDKRLSNGAWQWRGIGLVNFFHWIVDRKSNTTFEVDKTSEQYDFQRNKWESILRNSFTYQHNNTVTDFGLELAYNDINVNTRYAKTDEQGNTNQIILPAANVEVDELRGELFFTQQWRWDNGFDLLMGISSEYSKITATGDSESKQNFNFIKPKLVLGYLHDKSWQSQLRFERTVNQLDFKLFAAQSDADNGRDQAGNTALKPDSYYELSLTSDIQFNKNSALKVSVFHQWYKDVLEYKLTSTNSQILKNSGNATVYGVNASLSYSIDQVIKGGLITASVQEQESDYFDTIINKNRRLTGEQRPSVSIEFRQDLPNLDTSWGLTYQAKEFTEYYFVKELAKSRNEKTWQAFFEYKGFEFANMKLTINQINNNNINEQRYYYEESRADNPNTTTFIERAEPWQLQLSLSKSF